MDEMIQIDDTKQFIIIKFDSEQYGINIEYIDNIVRLQAITRVPHTQSYFVGIINLRGEIIPVMSMRSKFGLPDKENTNASRILILKMEGNAKIGVLVDEVKEVVTSSEESIEKTSVESGDIKAYLSGVGKYNNSLISILNIGAVIADIDNE